MCQIISNTKLTLEISGSTVKNSTPTGRATSSTKNSQGQFLSKYGSENVRPIIKLDKKPDEPWMCLFFDQAWRAFGINTANGIPAQLTQLLCKYCPDNVYKLGFKNVEDWYPDFTTVMHGTDVYKLL